MSVLDVRLAKRFVRSTPELDYRLARAVESTMRYDALRLAAALLMTFAVTPASAQTVAKIDFESVGRAWPLKADLNTYHMTGATLRRTLGNPAQRSQIPPDPRRDPTTGFVGSARNGETPRGIEPLAVDL